MEDIHTIEKEKQALLDFMGGLDPTDPKYKDALLAYEKLDSVSRMTKQEADVECHKIDFWATGLTCGTSVLTGFMACHAEQVTVISQKIWNLGQNLLRPFKR